MSKQAEAKRDGVINPQNYNFNQLEQETGCNTAEELYSPYCRENVCNGFGCIVLMIYVASAVFQSYRDLEAGDHMSWL